MQQNETTKGVEEAPGASTPRDRAEAIVKEVRALTAGASDTAVWPYWADEWLGDKTEELDRRLDRALNALERCKGVVEGLLQGGIFAPDRRYYFAVLREVACEAAFYASLCGSDVTRTAFESAEKRFRELVVEYQQSQRRPCACVCRGGCK